MADDMTSRSPAGAVPWAIALLLALCGIAFGGFTAVGGAIAAGMTWLPEVESPAPGFVWRTMLKAAAGGFLCLASAALCWRLAGGKHAVAAAPPAPVATPRWAHAGLIAVLLAGAALAFPRLDVYPWAAPDETHHLTVARNLAFFGDYASGHPESGLRRFDSFDSVGPPVIAPVAAALWLRGETGLAAARRVMALYFLALLVAVYALVLPIGGAWAAAGAALGTAAAFSSPYLARTLYGEAPAWFWFVTGLCLWRGAFGGRGAALLGAAAGACIGLAILCKNILLLAAFPFAAVLFAEWRTRGRLPLTAVVPVAAGALLMLGSWSLLQAAFRHDVAGGAEGTIALYRHYLLAGLPAAMNNLGYFAEHPMAHAALAAGLAALWTRITAAHRDPAMQVMTLTGLFFIFWWTFFTPGQLHRYLWFGYAALTALLGWLGVSLIQRAAAARQWGVRFALLVAVCLLWAPNAAWITHQAREIYGNSEMAHDHALAAHLAADADAEVRTPFYPLEGAMNFLALRRVLVTEDAAALWAPGGIAVLREDQLGDYPPPADLPATGIGPYRVFALREAAGTPDGDHAE